jgi:predicted outer membrane protein
MNLLCKHFKSKSCKRLSFDLTHYREIPQIWPSKKLYKKTHKFVENQDGKFKKVDIKKFMTTIKKEMNLDKVEGDCFTYRNMHLSKIQRVFAFILNKEMYRYSYKKSFIKTVYNKLSHLILPYKYKALTTQKSYGRKLQAVTKTKKVFDSDTLIGTIQTIQKGLFTSGCLVIGYLKISGAQDVKSPYSKAQIAALNAYRKQLKAKFDSAYISNKQKTKQMLLKARQERTVWVNQLKKKAAIDFKKKPIDKTPAMKKLYTKLQKELNALVARINNGKQRYSKVTATMKQLKAKKVENKALYDSIKARKALRAHIRTLVKREVYLRTKIKWIKKKYLNKPNKGTLTHIPQYFTNQNIKVMEKLDPKSMTYNISVIPNWINYLRVKIHEYGQQYNTTVNEYITTRALWKKYREMSDKA